MATESGSFSTLGRGWRWLNRFGLAVPLVIGAALVVIVTITAISPRYQSPQTVNAGPTTDYEIAAPIFFEDERFWVVQPVAGEFLALYDRDPITGCTVPFDKNREFLGRTGWFRDACSESTYDVTGACFGGACIIGMNRLDLEIVDGEVIVDTRGGTHGVLREDNGEPVNPPQ